MIEHVIKINGKVFTIENRIPGMYWELVCPEGSVCFACFRTESSGTIFHRDSMGKIQSEPFTL